MSREAQLKSLLTFLDRSISPFHAVEQAKLALSSKGFQEIRERDPWDIKAGGKYFFTRNRSTLIAFAVGGKYKPGNGFSIIGAHTDSPCLKVKPRSKVEAHGYLQLAVQQYGGGLWHTWFDRDLTLGGRVIVQEGANFNQKLVHIKKPILRIPTLAIHLDREVTEKGFAPNKESHLLPVLALAVKQKLEVPVAEPADPSQAFHHPLLLELLSKDLGCEASQIRDFELCLADTQPGAIGGARDDFIFSPRLDNLASSYQALQGLISSCENGSLEQDPSVRMITLFDHEEVGSLSSHGADSLLMESTLRRLSLTPDNQCALELAIPKSFIISADMAHGVHPNYSEKHEARHRPELNKGVVIKHNANQRYATNATTAFVIKEIARRKNLPIQEFVVRNDTACGSTIGPIVSGGLGIRAVDVGTPQLSMHSIREMCGADDLEHAVKLFEGFFTEFPSLLDAVQFD